MNSVNTSVQGRDEHILTSADSLLALLRRKIVIWRKRAIKVILKYFHWLKNIARQKMFLIWQP
jgi:CRISPR/Cas system CMR-associated protein Cmr5 small subunit